LRTFCVFLGSLLEEADLADELFEQVVVFLCLCYGQDELDAIPESDWDITHALMADMLGPKGGRRGEMGIRNILEGKVSRAIINRFPEADRKVTRGAVM